MADIHTEETRSYNMSRIRCKDTKPELFIRNLLYKRGLRYRLNVKKLPGTPDIVLSKHNTVIFVNGCFWHGHQGCKMFVTPKTRTNWWMNKINDNITRDKNNIKKLFNLGWKVITIWECEIENFKSEKAIDELINIIVE